MVKRKLIWLICGVLLFALGFIYYQYSRTDPIISLSVSSDGRYVISAHAPRKSDLYYPTGQLTLWDIEKKEKKILADNANAYSASFIPDSYEFIWQDDKNIVHIQNVDGQELEKFNHFWVVGHLMSADKSFYLSVNENGELYKGYSNNIIPIYTDAIAIIPLTLSMTKDYFLLSGNTGLPENKPVAETNLTANPINLSESKKRSYDGVTLWDRHTLKPVARLWGNVGKTTGQLSPDGNWVVTGGENWGNYMWEVANITTNRQKLSLNYDNIPEKFKNKSISTSSVIAIAFVTDTEFVTLRQSSNKNGFGEELATLYTVGDPRIKAYVEIGNDPSISTNYYQRNLSVSSAPKAHILVTGQATGGGINVYKYHPDKMELEKIWVAD
ncbi:WD40 repeat domain-containing protein [Actinobacillus equuli subsp. haemolyticus]|uniref:WD40 repeat domain-containing protein n=1 Tax=Actinobacillus equuli TaxID=718 RepID=UPI00244674B5|nr:WD40 repeat domain-containing protein [Actinobacillus equuli]WGE74435.1 WD40 repeat domain-containing protein [Actinobacillus equuli subsp. haemolyticus]